MGIQINGQTDTITAVDGGLIVSGADFTGVSAGTTAAPSISPSGDSNTGIFFPNADTIAFAEGGVEAARFDSSGNLGVGTVSPISARLHVFGGGGLTVERQTGGTIAYFKNTGTTTPNIAFQASGTTYTPYIGVNNDDLLFGTGSSGLERVRLDSSGRMTTPYQPYAIMSIQSVDTGSTSNKVTSTSGALVTPTAVVSNNFNLYNSTNGRFTAPVSGLYEFGFSSNMQVATATTWISVSTWKNNSTYLYHYADKVAVTWQFFTFSDRIPLSANDYLELRFASGGGSVGSDVPTSWNQVYFRLIG